MHRRKFLINSAFGTCGILHSNAVLTFLSDNQPSNKTKLTFGIVTDVHHGMLPDTETRLEKFIEEATYKDVDFIVQLGDFCHPETKSNAFLNIWNHFKQNKYHVLGNHDMDLGTKETIMDFWGMKSNYYFFVEKGVKFIVLDANYLYHEGQFINYANANFYVDDKFRTFINDAQIEWFDAELAGSELPVIVFSHQSLWHYQSGVKNRLSLQKLLEQHFEKIICCFNGHNHIDFHHYQNGIHYFDINSMSYQWMGEKYKTSRYPADLLKEYQWLEHLAPYEDPFYAFVEIDLEGLLEIRGKNSEWLAPSPMEVGVPKQVYGNEHSAVISDYEIRF